MKKPLHFTVDSALLSELGEKIVESVHVALVELIKNAYDADSFEVKVNFIPQPKFGPEIRIQDNGSGMTFDEVRKYWMRIATTNKADAPVSPLYGRPKTGAKGIGRFCCRRLGTKLELITTAVSDGRFETTRVIFPWENFVAGSTVTDIECEGVVSHSPTGRTGTTLVISGAPTDEWTKRGYHFLKREIGVLAANRGADRGKPFKPDPGFDIRITAPQFSARNEDLRAQVIGAGWGTLTGKFNAAGRCLISLDAMGIGKKEIESPDFSRDLKGITFEIGIFSPMREDLRNKEAISTGSLRRIVEEWGGVQIKHNGFRVYPYGDDDWLNIDKDRSLRAGATDGLLRQFASRLKGVDPSRALLNLLSMRNHVGTIEITSQNKGFEMKASREGFIKSDSFILLAKIVRFSIDWATIYRDFYIRTQQIKDVEDARLDFERATHTKTPNSTIIETAAKYIEEETRQLTHLLPKAQRARASTRLLSATRAIIEKERLNKNELLHLRLIASTSTLLLIFAHEIKSLLGTLQASAVAMEQLAPELKGKMAADVRDIQEGLLTSKTRLSDLLELTAVVSAGGKSAAAVRLALSDKLRRSIAMFKLIVDTYDIKIDTTQVPDNIMVGPMLEAELFAVLLNVLSNSIKAVIAGGRNRKISFSADREGRKVKLTIQDNGIGLSEKQWQEVFAPFISDPDGKLYSRLKASINPQDSHIIGSGTGLGLSIVKEVLEAHDGAIYFSKPSTSTWATQLNIEFPSK